ncbi:MAG: hypothetical protein IKS18_02265 [Lachnospiraceae bacterium]|nr:hypothetical protein [Lachnospiraceae bacterium]
MKKWLSVVLAAVFLLFSLTGCVTAGPVDPDAETDEILIRYKNTLYLKYQKVTRDSVYLEDYIAENELKEVGKTEKELKNAVPKENLAANNLPKGTRLFYEEPTRLLYYEDADGCLIACCAVSMMDGRVLSPTGSPIGMEGYMIRWQGKNYFSYGDGHVKKSDPAAYCEELGAKYIGNTVKQTYFASELTVDLAAGNLPLGTDVWYLESADCLYAEVPDWGIIKLTVY